MDHQGKTRAKAVACDKARAEAYGKKKEAEKRKAREKEEGEEEGGDDVEVVDE